MPQVHYPFIDVAVHPAVRARFAAGDAVVLFSRDMADVLWSNGEGARLFGYPAIYDLIERGPDRGAVSFRQLAATAQQLSTVGDRRGFVIRTASGFRSTAVPAEVGLIALGGEDVVMFSAPAVSGKEGLSALLTGFDDPDTHMALLSADGTVLQASGGFSHVGVMQDSAQALITAANRSAEGLVKRPIPSGSGYLPAAIGRLADDLYLLFCVETAIGRMDAPEDSAEVSPVPAAVANEDPGETPAGPSGEAERPAMADNETASTVVDADAPTAAVAPEDDISVMVPEPASLPEEGMAASVPFAGSEPRPDDVAEAIASIEDSTDKPEDAPSQLSADIAESAEEALPPVDFDASSSSPAEDESDQDGSEDAPPAEQTGEDALEPAAAEPLASADWEEQEDHQAPDPSTSGDDVALSPVEPDIDAGHDDDAPATVPSDDSTRELHATDLGEGDRQSSDAVFDADVAAEDGTDDALPAVAGSHPADVPVETTPFAADPVGAEVEAAARDAVAETAEPILEPEAAEEKADGASADVPAVPFQFDPKARPVRFVWKLDAGGVFAEVSDEFARTVGPHAGAIVGQAFRDLAAVFNLDPDHQIADLLDRRDTWSGRTVKWPVEGTSLVVPVDLAALPTYSRDREFDGFRGFGIIRVGDAETDPQGHGLMIAESATGHPEAGEGDEATTKGDDTATELSIDEFRGEVPALDIVSNPLASFSDKIIQLEERRAKAARDGLSPNEQAALKEIARQLEPFGKRPNEDILKTSSGLLQTEEADLPAEVAPAADAMQTSADTGGDVLSEFEGEDDEGLDDQGVQSFFEDLGTGPGLTAYAIDQVPMAILIHAGDRLIEANSEFRRLTGYDTIAALERAGGLDALITRREGPDAGVYLVRADGTQVLISARLQSVRYEGASALMLALTPAVGSLAAATAEPQIVGENEPALKLAALQVEVEELRSILETATDGVIVLDTEGRVRSMNRSASALFNFDDGEIRGRPFVMLFAHESQKQVQDYLAGLAGHGVASVLNDGREVIGREASGGFIPLFMTMGRMPGSNSYCAVIRDITQWKRSEEELRAAKRAAETANQHKSDFLARVSHEIRTPLNAIIGFSDMIATEHFGPAGHSRYVEYASDIGRSGRHVLDIVNDLLDISKIEAGEMDLDFGAVGLNDCVSEAVSLVQPQANAQRVIIRTSLSQAVPDVVADLRSIKQIALNILANAIRYTPSGGQIVVSTAYELSGSVTLRIRDTGVGMSKAELEQAMKPFGQVASGTRQRGDGTGLGLPLTRAMTEANRATFAIHSAPNEGTLVEITFPPQRVLAD
jgi:PAS domain S-box-containing protein